MYIKRFVENSILEWKNRKNHRVLELRGARQVGKTTTLLHFCNENYENVVYIDMSEKTGKWFLDAVEECKVLPRLATVLDFVRHYADGHSLAFTNDSNSVIVIDEIQENQDVYEMIRPFRRDLEYDVIVTRSYFGKLWSIFSRQAT